MKLLLITTILLLSAIWSYADSCPFTNEKIVNAIYHVEGGAKTKHPFGILSVKVSGYDEARRVCMNTVRNNRKRWIKAGAKGDFLEFLQSRYCPTRGNLSAAERRVNGNWLSNLRKKLSRGKFGAGKIN